jgi:hypothetical protein
MKWKLALPLTLVLSVFAVWVFRDKLALRHVGEYRQVDKPAHFLIAESSGRVISNALEPGKESEYKWFETSDDHDIYLVSKSPQHDFPIRWESADWPFVYQHITVYLADGVPIRFRKVR